MIYESKSVEETIELGIKLGKLVKPGDVIALDGDLGAGKTVITRGITTGIGLNADEVCSPTYTIVNEYVEPSDVMPLFHFDTYRLSGASDFLDSGLDEYFYREGVCVIEWSSIIEELLPENTILITIRGTGDTRTIEIRDPEGRL